MRAQILRQGQNVGNKARRMGACNVRRYLMYVCMLDGRDGMEGGWRVGVYGQAWCQSTMNLAQSKRRPGDNTAEKAEKTFGRRGRPGVGVVHNGVGCEG